MKWFALLLVLGIATASCRSGVSIPPVGHVIDVRRSNGERMFLVVDAGQVDALCEALSTAKPSNRSLMKDADFVFTEFLDGAKVRESKLFRDGILYSDGKWMKSDDHWHYRWRLIYDPSHAKRPNQTPEPTPTAVTSRADARVAPAAVVAHL